MDDREEQLEISKADRENRAIHYLLAHEGWELAIKMLGTESLDSLSTLPKELLQNHDYDILGKEVAMRSYVKSVFDDWLGKLIARSEIYSNKKLESKEDEDAIINRG